MKEPRCPYCGQPAELVGGVAIYPHRRDLFDRIFWRCQPCGAYVGCHRGTEAPLGTLANAELRLARTKAHAEFDVIWKLGAMGRNEAYSWLARNLKINVKDCHIGQFDLRLCAITREAVRGYHNPKKGIL